MSFTFVPDPKEHGKVLFKWAVLLLIFAGILVAAGIILLTQIPEIGEQLPANSAPILVTLTQPQDYQSAVWFTEVSLDIEAFSQSPISRLELWANGELAAEYTPEVNTAVSWETGWTPGAAGEFSVMVRAFDINGQSVISNRLHFTSLDTPGAHFDYTMQDGDSLESIAERFQASLASLEQANPGTQPVPGAQIIIPLDQGVAPQTQPGAAAGGTDGVSPTSHAIDNLKFWLTNLSGSSSLPPAPSLTAGFSSQAGQCDVQLTIGDLSDLAFGYFIYRADAGGSFERIATLARGNGSKLSYTDPGQQAMAAYYAAAFNPGGESPSPPAGLDLTALGCGGPANTAGLQLHGSQLTIPGDIESVYFYLSINQGDWQRAPALDGWFLPVEDQQVDISPLISEYGDLPANSSLRLEVWGWVGGELIKIGALETTLSSTELIACTTPDSCPQGNGWGKVLTVAPDSVDLNRLFSWTTSSLEAEKGIWQVSTSPYPESFTLTPPGLLMSGLAGEAISGNPISGSRFSLDIGSLAMLLQNPSENGIEIPDQELELGWLMTDLSIAAQSTYQIQPGIDSGLVFYVRIIGMSGNQPVGEPSNTITVYYHPETEQENPLVDYPIPPDIYQIEIQEFTPIIPPSLGWGCMLITALDYQTFVDDFYQTYGHTADPDVAYNIALQIMNNQIPVCPDSYKGVGEKPWYQSMWDFASGALSWVSEAYDDIKQAALSKVASALDALPGIECNADCKASLEQGLNAGLIALGIPPELPNLDQLTDQGLSYLAEVAAAEAGISCDPDCIEIISQGIKDIVEDVQKTKVAAICNDVEYAHQHGKEPLCFLDGITLVPAPGSSTQPASLSVQISRYSDPAEVDAFFMSQYTYLINFPAENDLGTDSLNVQIDTGFYEGSYSVASYSAPLPINNPIRSALFYELTGPIPPLSPGESITMTFSLNPSDYWLPGHQDLISAGGGFVRYNDYWTLYYDAELDIVGEIICPWYDPIYQPTISCGGSDTLEYIIP